jgi:hypothetical protein
MIQPIVYKRSSVKRSSQHLHKYLDQKACFYGLLTLFILKRFYKEYSILIPVHS